MSSCLDYKRLVVFQAEDSDESSSSDDESSGEEYVCDDRPDSDDSFSEPEPSQEDPPSPQSNRTDDPDSDVSSGPSRTNKNFCYVCGKPQRKMSRHLFTHRKTDPEIAEAFALPKLSKERKKLLNELLRRGNHKHNQEVLKTQKGCLKARMTSDEFSLKTSAACIYCKVLFSRGVFWSHLRKCPSRISTPPAGSRSQILALVSTGLTNPQHMPSGLRRLLRKLKEEEDDPSSFQDPFALQLAQCLYHFSQGKSKDAEVKMKLKLTESLLSALKQKSVFSFGDALKPQNFGSVAEAVRRLSGPDKDTPAYKKRSSKLVSSLRKMADIKYATALNDGVDMEMMQETEEFIKLSVKEWHSNVPVQLRVPCPSTLPFIHDVQTFFRYIQDVLTSAIESLSMYASPPVYTALLKVTVAYVAVLNRTVQEVSDVTLESFQTRNQTENPAASRSPYEEVLSRCTVKVAVANKHGKKVDLVLTRDLLTAVNLLVEKRRTCSVPENQRSLFAKPGASSSATFKGFGMVALYLRSSGVKDHAGLKSPYFRKHTATIFHVLNFTDEDLGQVAALLGRDIRTDREFYRKPEAAADVAKILMLLSALETECLDVFEGTSLEDIEVPGASRLRVVHRFIAA